MIDPSIDRDTYDHLLEITGGDLEFLDELVETYLADAEQQLEAMRGAAAADDAAALIRPVHTLKSSSANVGALTLAEVCRSLEADARAGAVPDFAARVESCATTFEAARRRLLALRASR
jgi:HPt (histidine-containing phosphotransfer) domain-containing protein